MSGVFIDGGGHDSLSHGGDGIDHGGHDHGSHGIQHGHGQGGQNFLASILGLDQQDHAHLAHHGGEGAEGQAPSQTPAWNSALQGLKLENLIAGINITPNFLLFALFASFVGWLGVIYWIRHHEPFANQVLGSSAAFAPTVGADRQLINGCRDALPLKTTSGSGIVYSPQPGQNSSEPPAGSQVNANLSAAMGSAFGQGPTAAAPAQSCAQQGQTYAAAPQGSSPVNQGLSAAMLAALGPGLNPGVQQAAQQESQPGYAPAAAPGYSQAPATYPMGQQMMPQSMAQYMPQASAAPGMAGGNMRLFSSRQPSISQGAPMAGSGGNMRLFSSRRPMMSQGQAAAPQYAQAPAPQYGQPPALQYAPPPALNPNSWSLANQGAGTFSADTAQFNSQFGAPLQGPGATLSAGSYPVSTPEGTRLKVVTDR